MMRHNDSARMSVRHDNRDDISNLTGIPKVSSDNKVAAGAYVNVPATSNSVSASTAVGVNADVK